MDSVLKSDIFFFVTTILLVIVAIFLIAALVYVILILRDIRNISHTVKEEAGYLAQDVEALRSGIKTEGGKALKHFAEFFGKIFKRNVRRRTNRKKPKGE